MDEILKEIRRYHSLNLITDEEIIPYVELAEMKIKEYIIKDEHLLKAKAFLTLALLGQKLWIKVQQRANEYDESLETFKDIEHWQNYWLNLFNNLTIDKDISNHKGAYQWTAI